MPGCDPSHFGITDLMKNKQLQYALPAQPNVKLQLGKNNVLQSKS